MKTIEQDCCEDLKIDSIGELMLIQDSCEFVALDKQGAKQLIEVLNEWVITAEKLAESLGVQYGES